MGKLNFEVMWFFSSASLQSVSLSIIYWNSTMYQTPVSTTNTQWYQIKVSSRQYYFSLENVSIPKNQWLLTRCQFYCTVGLKLHKPSQMFRGTGYVIISQPHKPSVWNLFTLVLLSSPTSMEMLEPAQHCKRTRSGSTRQSDLPQLKYSVLFCMKLIAKFLNFPYSKAERGWYQNQPEKLRDICVFKCLGDWCS